MKEITIYTTSTCPYCKEAKDFFKEKGIKYKEIDVENNEKAQKEMIEKSGGMSVPVIVIEDEVMVGFDKDAVKDALGLK